MARKRALPVRMYRWVVGDKKQKPPPAGATKRGEAHAHARMQLPALTFDPTTWLHEFVEAHPEGSLVIRDRVSHGIIYECQAGALVASGVSLLQHMTADLGHGHYYVQGRHLGKDGKHVLGEHNAVTVGTPQPLQVLAAVNTATKSSDAMTQLDGVLTLVQKAEPIIDKLLGNGKRDDVSAQIMARAVENMLNPPDQIAQLVESKRLIAELVSQPGTGAAPVATPSAGDIMMAQGMEMLTALVTGRVAERVKTPTPTAAPTPTPTPTPAAETAPTETAPTEAAATETPTPSADPMPEQPAAAASAKVPEDDSLAGVAERATKGPVGFMMLQTIKGACRDNNPELIAEAALKAYDHAEVQRYKGPLMAHFVADPGAVFDQFHRLLVAKGVTTPPEVFASARDIVVMAVADFRAAEQAGPIEIDGDDEHEDASPDAVEATPVAPDGGGTDEAGGPRHLTVVVQPEAGKAATG